MKFTGNLLVLTSFAALLAACSPAPESSLGFRLPDGDPEYGKKTFIDMQCHACHTVPGVDMPVISIAAPVSVALGGPVSQVKTYGRLVTAIINPSHKLISTYPKNEVSSDGQSFMPNMNEFMTVRQLIDIVAFLQDQYRVIPPTPYYPYSVYRYDPLAPVLK